jgi:hypothetical protein
VCACGRPSARSAIRADAKRLGGTRKIEVLRLTGFHRIRERELTIVVSAMWSATLPGNRAVRIPP